MVARERLGADAPPIPLDEEHRGVYEGLYRGVRSHEDPVTWRTLVVDLRRILGSSIPDRQTPPAEKFSDAYELVNTIVGETDLESLTPEIMTALGFGEMIEETREGLDAILFNGRHFPEPLLYTLADELKRRNKRVAVVNPIGYYSDGQTRPLNLHLVHPSVDHLVILSSTQEKQGGDLKVLEKAIWTIANRKNAGLIKELDVVIPMYGGSRGHRPGQDELVGYEVEEAISNAVSLCLNTTYALRKLAETSGEESPKTRFFSVDIHSREQPKGSFAELGFEFVNADPSVEFAEASYRELERRGCLEFPIKVIACDRGSIPRTETMIEALLDHPHNTLKSVDMIFMEKTRYAPGLIAEARLVRTERWSMLPGGNLERVDLPVPTKEQSSNERCVLLFSDDMIDTGATNKSDLELVCAHYPNARLTISIATHPVLSKGVGVLDDIGADLYIFGNTLRQDDLLKREDVVIEDMAPAIARVILGE